MLWEVEVIGLCPPSPVVAVTANKTEHRTGNGAKCQLVAQYVVLVALLPPLALPSYLVLKTLLCYMLWSLRNL